MKLKTKEEREFDQMMKEEIEGGNPFSKHTSYKSYLSSQKKKVDESTSKINSGPNK